MAILFSGTEESKTDTHTMLCYANNNNNIYINIDMNVSYEFDSAYICLDKQTAIRLAKELRRQIALLED